MSSCGDMYSGGDSIRIPVLLKKKRVHMSFTKDEDNFVFTFCYKQEKLNKNGTGAAMIRILFFHMKTWT